jgi:hypothetical protein
MGKRSRKAETVKAWNTGPGGRAARCRYNRSTKGIVKSKAQHESHRNKRIAAKACVYCGRPKDLVKRLACSVCLLVRAEKRLARASSGFCLECAAPAEAGTVCLHHWFARIGQHYSLTTKNGGVEMLKRLWIEQKGLCALTGEALVPGSTASLDHIVPRKKGGTSVKDNLQWVLLAVNVMKGLRSQDEFLSFCKKVTAHSAAKVEEVALVEVH